METLWGGYAVFAPGLPGLFFAGDTGYSKDFADIHARFAARHGGVGRGFDLALLPIGAYEPRWFMEGAAHRSGRGGADPPRPRRPALDRHPLGHLRAHRRGRSTSRRGALETARRQRGLADDAFTVMAIGETRRFRAARVLSARAR